MRQRIGSIFRFVKQTFTIASAVGSRKIQVVRAVDKMWLSKFPKDSECHSVILMVAKVVLLLFCFCSILFIQIWVQKLKFYFLVYTCLWNHWLHIQYACMNACSVTSVVSDSVTPWTGVPQACQSMRLSRQEYWSKLPFPSPCIQPGGNVYLLQPLSHFRAITLKCLFFVIFSNRV